jgi:hypothetical protein
MSDPPWGDQDWTDDSARTFVAGGVGLLCDMAVDAANVDGGAVAFLSTTSKSRELMCVTDPVAERIDELQFLIGEGPCLDAYRSGRPRLAADLDADHTFKQWPAFATEASSAGAGAVFAYPVGRSAAPIGVLELYRRTSGELTAHQHEAALQCARAVGTVLSAAWEGLCLRSDESAAESLARLAGSSPLSRWQVHVAAGMVAEQLSISIDEAIDRVRAFSFASGRRLLALSEDILARRVSFAGTLDD